MELILLESVEGLGRPGDRVKVKPGYARNFLLPTGRAVVVSKDILRHSDKLKQKADKEEREALASTKELAQKLAGFEVEVKALATEEGHLFGSVTEQDIQEALGAAGWKLPDKAVRLEAHVKEAGIASAEVHLYAEIHARVRVNVVPVDVHGDLIEPEAPEPRARDAEPPGAGAQGDAPAPATVDSAATDPAPEPAE